MNGVPRWIYLGIWIALNGCVTDGAETMAAGRDAPASEREVVSVTTLARVNDTSITRGALERSLDVVGGPVEALLERMVDEELLVQAADAAQIQDEAMVRDISRRAQVQAYLAREVEEAIHWSDADTVWVEEAYVSRQADYQQPERRRIVHLLATVNEAAEEMPAREFVAEFIEAALGDTSPERRFIAMRNQPVRVAGWPVRVESLAPIRSDVDFDPTFLSASFSLDSVGIVEEPVRSRFGWHAVYVAEILPPVSLTREQAQAQLREERLADLRRARLDELVRALAERTPVHVDEALFEQAAMRLVFSESTP